MTATVRRLVAPAAVVALSVAAACGSADSDRSADGVPLVQLEEMGMAGGE